MVKFTKPTTKKVSKPEKKHESQLHNLIKDLRPKVYITDSSSFKKLVQELTGNISNNQESYSSSPVTSQPIPSTYVPAQTWEVPMFNKETEEEHGLVILQENTSDVDFFFEGSPCFSMSSSSMEGSQQDSYLPQPALNYPFEDSFDIMLKNLDFESQFRDLESLLMGTDDFDSCDYDFDLSALM